MTDLRGEARHYSWVVRNGDDESWRLLPSRWEGEQETLDTADHWHRHYAQARAVEVVTKWRVIE